MVNRFSEIESRNVILNVITLCYVPLPSDNIKKKKKKTKTLHERMDKNRRSKDRETKNLTQKKIWRRVGKEPSLERISSKDSR